MKQTGKEESQHEIWRHLIDDLNKIEYEIYEVCFDKIHKTNINCKVNLKLCVMIRPDTIWILFIIENGIIEKKRPRMH